MRRSILIALAAILCGVGTFAAGRVFVPCSGLEKIGLSGLSPACPLTKAVTESAPPPPAITVEPAAMHTFTDRQFVSGTLVAREEAMVGVQLDGLRIIEILADDGDWVSVGQVLARLDRSQLDTQLAQSDAAIQHADAAIAQARNQISQFEASLVQATADLERSKKLGAQIVTEAMLDQRVATQRVTQAQLDGAKNALRAADADKASREAERRELMVRIDRAEVKAPVSGIVSRRAARIGAMANGTGDALFRIIVDGAIDLDAEIPEQSLARFRLGLPAVLRLPGDMSEVPGRVRLISQEIDKATRLGKVRIAVADNVGARIGSFASGAVIVERRQGLAVLSSSIQKQNDSDEVQVVADGRITARKIVAGIVEGNLTEAREGMAPGEIVVARAASFLRPGDTVRPVGADDLGTDTKAIQ